MHGKGKLFYLDCPTQSIRINQCSQNIPLNIPLFLESRYHLYAYSCIMNTFN